jgi:hypothetical protein
MDEPLATEIVLVCRPDHNFLLVVDRHYSLGRTVYQLFTTSTPPLTSFTWISGVRIWHAPEVTLPIKRTPVASQLSVILAYCSSQFIPF